MNTYKITLKSYDTDGHFTLISAETAGKAKYQHYLQLDDLFDSFETYLSYIESCKCLRKAKKEDFYRCSDTFVKTKNYRGVPLADYGTKVMLNGKTGFIISDNSSCNFDVKFDNGIFNCHPNYELVYFDENDNIIYDFRSVKANA